MFIKNIKMKYLLVMLSIISGVMATNQNSVNDPTYANEISYTGIKEIDNTIKDFLNCDKLEEANILDFLNQYIYIIELGQNGNDEIKRSIAETLISNKETIMNKSKKLLEQDLMSNKLQFRNKDRDLLPYEIPAVLNQIYTHISNVEKNHDYSAFFYGFDISSSLIDINLIFGRDFFKSIDDCTFNLVLYYIIKDNYFIETVIHCFIRELLSSFDYVRDDYYGNKLLDKLQRVGILLKPIMKKMKYDTLYSSIYNDFTNEIYNKLKPILVNDAVKYSTHEFKSCYDKETFINKYVEFIKLKSNNKSEDFLKDNILPEIIDALKLDNSFNYSTLKRRPNLAKVSRDE